MIMLGAPGSGKGTLTARLLAAHSGRLTALASGDLLRSEMAANSEIGQRAKQAIADGRLLDDDSMISIIVAEMQRRNWVNSQQSWLLDGFPRTLEQARRLDSVLTASGPINLVVQLMVPEEAIVKRLCDRWIHEASGRVYNTSYNPPKHPGRDDVTGERLVRRADDEPVSACRDGGGLL